MNTSTFALTAALALGACAGLGARAARGADAAAGQGGATVSLQIVREWKYCFAAVDFHVQIDGTEIGAVGNGDTKTLNFTPDAKGNQLVLFTGGLVTAKSEPVTLRAAAGTTVRVKCRADNWQNKLILEGQPVVVDAPARPAVAPPPPAMRVEIDPETKRIEMGSEEIELPRGVVVRTRKSRTIEHAVNFTDGQSAGATLTADLPVLKAEVRGQIEKRLDQTFKQSETIEQEITLDGNVCQKYRLTWYDKVRTGVAEVPDGGTTRELPFQFKEWSELKIAAMKD